MHLRFKLFFLLLFIFLVSMPLAYAMHIAEGMLTYKWSLLWWLAVSPCILIGLYRIKKLKQLNPLYLPLLSTIAAALFIFSMVPLPVPITGTTSHPTGTGLSVLLLGVLSTTVISFISLFIQAVFLGHGGLTTLGANIFSMGIAGPIIGLSLYYSLKKIKLPLGVRVFLASFFADISAYVITSGQLALSLVGFLEAGKAFTKFIILFIPIQLPIAILEGLVTSGIVKYIYTHKPDIIKHLV